MKNNRIRRIWFGKFSIPFNLQEQLQKYTQKPIFSCLSLNIWMREIQFMKMIFSAIQIFFFSHTFIYIHWFLLYILSSGLPSIFPGILSYLFICMLCFSYQLWSKRTYIFFTIEVFLDISKQNVAVVWES